MIETAKLLLEEFPNLRFCIGCAPGLKQCFDKIIKGCAVNIELWDDSRKLLSVATTAVVCSGTATLETALIGTPQVIVYKTSGLNFIVIKKLIKLPYVGLVNIVAEEKIVTELLQGDFNPVALYRSIAPMIRSKNLRDYAMVKMMQVKNMLGEPGASRRVAELAHSMIA
jgi:lipid-A-disaccharide synthase